MTNKWRNCELQDVITLQRGHDLPKSKMQDGKIPVAGSNGIIGFHNQSTTHAPGVTIGRSGNLGNAYFYKEDFWAHNTTLYVKDFKGNNEAFIYYFLKALDFSRLNAGSAVPTLNRNHIHPIPVNIPPFPEQRAIAGILSSLDDKIDLLHRQNETLEALAQTLFRQWFIEEARDDWEEITLGEFVNCTTGYSYRSNDLNPSNNALVTLKNFGRDGKFRMDGFKEYTGDYKEEQIVQNKDLVVSHTDITQAADIIGNPILVINTGKYEKLIITMDLMKVETKFEWLSNEFLYYLFKSPDFKYHCLGYSNGTTVLHMSRKAIPEYSFLVPNRNKIMDFTSIVSPMISKQYNNIYQIETLEKLRDTLLPKLMSGEVRVKSDKTDIQNDGNNQ